MVPRRLDISYLLHIDPFASQPVLSLEMDRVQPVELLRRQYLQLVDPEQLLLLSQELLRLPDTQAQIFYCLFDESALAYSPPERYKLRVLKRLVNVMEQAIVDPEEDVRVPEHL